MDVTYAALQRLHRAIKALSQFIEHHETKQKITLFEASPTKDGRAFDAWKELHDAQGDAARALALGPEGECEAGASHWDAPRKSSATPLT